MIVQIPTEKSVGKYKDCGNDCLILGEEKSECLIFIL
jgi:hypothetical protein